MQLEPDALNSKEVLAAFEQLRKFSTYMNPNIAAQPWAVNLPGFVKGDFGMVMTGGWAQGNLFRPAPPWRISQAAPRRRTADRPMLRPQRRLFHLLEVEGRRSRRRAEAVCRDCHGAVDAGDVLEDHGLDSGAHRRQLAGEGFTDGQRTRRRF